MSLTVNPKFRELIPPPSPEELVQLESNLLADGCRDPLVVWNGTIVDGHNRYDICNKHNLPFKVAKKDFNSDSEAEVWIIKNQFGRRNLDVLTRVELAEKLKGYFPGQKRGRKPRGNSGQNWPEIEQPRDQLAEIAGVGRETYRAAKLVLSEADEETREQVRRNKKSVHRAANDIRRAAKKKVHAQKIKAAKARPKETEPSGPFDLVLADPPWSYEHCEANNREIENQYPTASLDAIFSHAPNTSPKSILFLWATAPKLEEAMRVLNAWGFSYRSCAVWDKEKMGMGYWWRIQHELLLVGVKGSPGATPECERTPSVFRSPRRKHSEKPECVYEWIERAFPLAAKLEMYCRKPRAGWAAWGNEV